MDHELRSLGIDIQPDVGNAPLWDYDLLYLPQDSPEELWKLDTSSDEIRACLPRRIVIGGNKGSEENTVCAFAEKPINSPQNQNDTLQIYDAWIKYLLSRRGMVDVGLSIYFEQLTATAEKWNNGFQNNKPDYIKDLKVFSGDSGKFRNSLSQKIRQVNLWRHIKLEEVLKNGLTNAMFYQECTYGDPFFGYLSSIDPTNSAQRFQADYLLRQIVEMVSCRVLIIDERIAQTIAAKKNAQTLAWMGIWIAGTVEFTNTGQSITIGTECDGDNGLIKVVIDCENGKFKLSIKYPSSLKNYPPAPGKIEILTIHQTILDGKFKEPLQKILQDNHQWKEGWILGLKPQVLSVYSHSGRGHPRELLPKNAPFLEYSFFQTHILSQPSKFFFVQSALACKEKRKSHGGLGYG